MTRYLENVPAAADVRAATAQVFARATEESGAMLLNALVPIDTTMEDGFRVLNGVVGFEMAELCDLVGYFDMFVREERDMARRGRIQLLVYSHIFEADFPMTTLWNLHRLLADLECSWTFHRTAANGKVHVCKYPRERVEELKRLSEAVGTDFGEIISGLWWRELRNGFSHSQYFWAGESVTCTGRLSPVSRTGTGIGEAGSKSFAVDDVNDLYDGTVALLSEFVTRYRDAVQPYKDGELHEVQGGGIVWSGGRGRWMWPDSLDT